ncbi:cbb3-type cytochrome oxidase assembly protein CcoS [Niveispirillum fermenti]|uniref:cbb3-type cytochrome oxidase assembly protein CcoS n=1 Tax=Niveispirillum fermenti TaxID=1233113 RepID=UPI003A885E5C
MNSLLFLIPIALGMGLAGLAAFLWSVRSGQFEDLDGAGARVLFDDGQPLPPAQTPVQPKERSNA